MYVRMAVCIKYVHVNVCTMYALCVCVCAVWMCMWASVYACMYVCVYVCKYVCMCVKLPVLIFTTFPFWLKVSELRIFWGLRFCRHLVTETKVDIPVHVQCAVFFTNVQDRQLHLHPINISPRTGFPQMFGWRDFERNRSNDNDSTSRLCIITLWEFIKRAWFCITALNDCVSCYLSASCEYGWWSSPSQK